MRADPNRRTTTPLLVTQKQAQFGDQLYQFLVEDEDARVCKDIPDSACTQVPANFTRILFSHGLSKLADALADSKTVLAWLMTAIGAPVFLTGLLVPLRESGSLLPQLAIAAYVRKLPIRKWVWVSGAIIQAILLGIIAFNSHLTSGLVAGLIMIVAVTLFSLARGLCSVAHKDVIGKTIPKTRRGRINGWATSLSGLVTIAIGFALTQTEPSLGLYSLLLCASALFWILAALLFSRIEEAPGETEGGGNAMTHALQKMKLLQDDRDFRNFILVRLCLLGAGLSAPFYVTLAQQNLEADVFSLGLFMLAGGIAALVSGPVWGKFADASSRQVLMVTSLLIALLGITVSGLHILLDGLPAILMAVAFFVLTLLHQGVRLGRKTYLIDLASGNKRTNYVAVGNTLTGVLLLVVGIISAAVASWSLIGAIGVFSSMALIGFVLARKLPEVQT